MLHCCGLNERPLLAAVGALQVMRSYREAQQVADALSSLGVLMRFACMWDPKAYKARQHTVAGLRKDMMLIRCVQSLCTGV
jgi:hypothetical protein